MRKNIEELQIAYTPLPGSGVVTISVGVAAARPDPRADPQKLLNEADKALYQAKAKGRNRVVAAQ